MKVLIWIIKNYINNIKIYFKGKINMTYVCKIHPINKKVGLSDSLSFMIY
jgi:hypothetical protein